AQERGAGHQGRTASGSGRAGPGPGRRAYRGPVRGGQRDGLPLRDDLRRRRRNTRPGNGLRLSGRQAHWHDAVTGGGSPQLAAAQLWELAAARAAATPDAVLVIDERRREMTFGEFRDAVAGAAAGLAARGVGE